MPRALARILPCIAALVVASAAGTARGAEQEPAVDERFRGSDVGAGSSVTSIAGSAGVLVGPELGVVAGDYVFGVAGYGLASAVEPASLQASGAAAHVHLGYGVAQMGAVLFKDEIVHVIPALTFGAGGVNAVRRESSSSEAIWLLEPKLELELALPSLRAVRFGARGSYRFVSAFELDGLTAAGLSGPAAGAFVKVGFF